MMGFHPANSELSRPFRSHVRSRHATDGQTGTANHFIMPLPTVVGRIINPRLSRCLKTPHTVFCIATSGKKNRTKSKDLEREENAVVFMLVGKRNKSRTDKLGGIREDSGAVDDIGCQVLAASCPA